MLLPPGGGGGVAEGGGSSARAEGRGRTIAGPYLTVREVAERLRVSTATVYAMVKTGEVPHVRVSNAIRVPAASVP